VTSSPGRPIHVSALGRLAVTLAGESVPALPAQRLRCALLVHLAVVRECTRDTLVALLWPDRTSDSARHALSQNLYELRRTLGDHWLETRGDHLVATASLSSDVGEFEAAAEAGQMERALELYRGPFLDGAYLSPSAEFEDWVERQRSRLARLQRSVRREHLEQRLAAGDHGGALRVASAAVASDPFDDEMQHHLIALLADTGDRLAALEQYDRYAAALTADGLEPLESTRDLVTSIRAAGGAADARLHAAFGPGGTRRANGATRANGMNTAAGAAGATASGAESAGTGTHAAGSAGAEAVERAPTEPASVAVSGAPRPGSSPTGTPARTGDAEVGAPRSAGAARGVATVVASLIGLVLLVWVIGRAGGGDPGNATASRAAEQRLAVLPFDRAGNGEEIEYLSAQLPIALIQQLRTEVPSLPVVSHYGVLQYAGANVPLDSVARALGATLLVGGSIVRAGDGVAVRVQLIDGATSEVLRTTQVRGTGSEPLSLISGVVQEVAHFLRSELGEELRMRRWRAGTDSDVAFDLFGRGEAQRQHWLMSMGSPDPVLIDRGLRTADSLFAAAEIADPRWPEPVLHRGRVAEHRAFYALTRREPAMPHFEAALAHVERALRIAPDHAPSLEARAEIRYLIWQTLPPVEQTARRELLREAEHDLQRALAADGDRPSAWSRLSMLYYTRGEFHLAYTAADQGYNADYYYERAFTLLDRRTRAAFEIRNDHAARQGCREGQERFPGQPPFLSCALLIGGWSSFEPVPPDSAWRIARQLVDLMPGRLAAPQQRIAETLVAANLARAGLADSARAVLRRAEAGDDRDAPLLANAAAVHLLLGDRETALARLDSLVAADPVLAYQTLRGRRFDPLRDDPRFIRLAGTLPD
jgi:DNA-binding SARP family transcriptional activator/TolB-like protein/tetratricopeptide (TPR) repeat protein